MLRHVRKVAKTLLGPDDSEEESTKEELLAGISLRYSYEDLVAATDGFLPEHRIGSGAAGHVYRGSLRGGTEVAIKVLAAGPEGLNGFEEELRVLSCFRHPNLVTLLGWGQHVEDFGTKYLVYELLSGGDVARRLQRCHAGEEPFSWQHRLRAAVDAACGLCYMVNSRPKAFHRDIKPPNILLDAYGTAKMADFGLSAMIQKKGQRHLTVENISGTPGYADPNYIQTGKVTEQSEVYSFGTVLLELLLNERPALSGPRGELVYPLVQLVQPAAPGALARILARLDTHAFWVQPLAEDLAQLALRCTAGRPEMRPSFEELVGKLRCLRQGDPPQQVAVPMPLPEVMVPTQRLPGRVPAWGEGPLPLPRHVQVVGCVDEDDHVDLLQGLGLADPRSASKLRNTESYSLLEPTVVFQQRHAFHGGNIRSVPVMAKSSEPLQTPCAHLRSLCAEQYDDAQHDGEDLSSGFRAPPRLRAPQLMRSANPRRLEEQLGELVLECTFADGVDLAMLLPCSRALAFPLVHDRGCSSAAIGRQHQHEFFEALVPRQDRLASISRSHFEITVEPGLGATLRRLSENPLVLDNCSLAREAAAPIRSGACVSFGGLADGEPPFLTLRLLLRSQSDVGRDGPRRALLGHWREIDATASEASAGAVLECSYALGLGPDVAGSRGPEARAILVPAGGELLEVGRQHQLGFFEGFLRADPRWLPFISRSHCKVNLLPGAVGRLQLRVENVSGNVVLVSGRPLARGHSDTLVEGGSLIFVARLPGEALRGGETEFLRLTLRPAQRPA